MGQAIGRHEQTGRDLVFAQWFADNVEPAGPGGALEESAIFKAYRRNIDSDRALGRQGVHRMLNSLGVKRSVRQGKPMRLGVGFRDESSPLSPVAASAPHSEAKPIEDPAIRASMDVFQERLRQRLPVSEGGEGRGVADDDASDPGALEKAAACYAYAAGQPDRLAPFIETGAKEPREGKLGWIVRDTLVMMWPWSAPWWKPNTDRPGWKRRCLVKAGALILAAIERHDREQARDRLEATQASQMTGL